MAIEICKRTKKVDRTLPRSLNHLTAYQEMSVDFICRDWPMSSRTESRFEIARSFVAVRTAWRRGECCSFQSGVH